MTNEPAFPSHDDLFSHFGMSLRAYIATHVLAGMRLPANYETGPCNSAAVERALILTDTLIKELS